MIAPPDTTAAEQFLVSYGKSGGLGSFSAAQPLALERGDRVIVDTPRGRELGTVLCPASVRQSRLLGAVASGAIVRPVTTADDVTLADACSLGRRLFEAARQLA